MRILLAASEVAPFAKTGGLADVVAALARHLHGAGHEVKVVMPLYARVAAGHDPEPVEGLREIPLRMGPRALPFAVRRAPLPPGGPEVLFVHQPDLYGREELYTNDPDEHLRFGLLCRAALVTCQWQQWSPEILHLNDWHTALVPLYLRTLYAWDRLFESTRTLLCIHNIGYQGVFPSGAIPDLDLEGERHLLSQDDLRRGQLNFLKTGVLFADALATVSGTYAREIQTSEQGMGLEEILRARSGALTGITNGVDTAHWDPRTDRLIPRRYSQRSLHGKRRNKLALLERLGLAADPGPPLFAVISRLVWQKGLDLLFEVLPGFLEREEARVVVLGSGEQRFEGFFHRLQEVFPDKAAFRQGYDEDLAHWIEAGSDLYLMPSRYEPCGLNQMYSMRYGTVPIVRRTGGLSDTVEDCDPAADAGTGFVFDSFTPEALHEAMQRALAVHRDPARWKRLQSRAMAQDFSWERAGARYEELYERLAKS